MSKTSIGIIALIAGLLIGVVGGTSLLGGAMMGAGVSTGLSTGICSTVQAAQELQYLTAEQVDEVLSQAAADLSGKAKLSAGEEIVGSAAACAEVMAKFEQARS